MDYRPALEIMEANGCRGDFEKKTVRTPKQVLRQCLSTAPSRFTLYGRDPRYDVPVDQRNVYTIRAAPPPSWSWVWTACAGPRPSGDLEDLTRLQDALANLHIMHGIVNPQDIPQKGFDRILFSAVSRNTLRNYYSQALGARGVRDQVEMASLLARSRNAFQEKPFFTIVVCLVSPLVHPSFRTEELMESATFGVPVYVEGDDLAGANILSGICLAEMVRPGLPCIYSIASGIPDMTTGSYSGGAPETQILHGATAQLAHSFGVPARRA